jgi:archaellum biogenesis ATPase FlaH
MLIPRLQAQAIHDYLEGLDVSVNQNDFIDVWARCWQAIQDKPCKADKIEALQQVLDLQNHQENTEYLNQILSAKHITIESLDEIKDQIRPIEWLWQGWIPCGLLTVLGAMQGAGKTALLLDFSRRITNKGESWPDSQCIESQGANVLYIDAEPAPEVIKERVIAMQMNLKRFYLKWPGDGEIFDLGLELNQDKVREWTYKVKPELVLIDSLSTINTKGENNVEDVRRILSFLVGLARDFHTGLILSHHTRKKLSTPFPDWRLTIDDFRGSGHITAMARSVIGMSVIQTFEEFDPNGPRKLEVLKTNLGPYPKPLGFEIVSGFPSGMSLKWGEAPKPYREPTKEELCVEWLQEILDGQEIRVKDIIEFGKDEGFSRAVIYRAHKKLDSVIRDTKGRKDSNNGWTLAKSETIE